MGDPLGFMIERQNKLNRPSTIFRTYGAKARRARRRLFCWYVLILEERPQYHLSELPQYYFSFSEATGQVRWSCSSD